MSGGHAPADVDPAATDAAVAGAFEREQLPWFTTLVDQPSHTYAREDVEDAARLVEAFATDLGLSVTRHPDPEGRFADHRVYASPAATQHARALLLVGHVDTVFPRSMGFLTLRRGEGDEADKVFGPGVLDMKSGISAMFFALRAAARVHPGLLAELPVRVLCNTDEEVGSPSSAALIRQLAPRTSRALVFEGGRVEDRIITRRKGGASLTLEVFGKSAHAGNDHAAGVSAIHALALLVPRIEALTDYARGRTVNVGIIEGGTAKNTVPDRARCIIDARFERAEDARFVIDALQEMVREPFAGQPDVPEKLHGVRLELSGGVTRPPMEATDATQALRRDYEACAAPVGLGVGEAPLQGGGSDANLLAAEGVPVIDGLGPYGQYFHNPREWSSLSSLRARTQALARFLVDEWLRARAGGANL